MATTPYAVLLGLCTFLYMVVYPVVLYYRDPKGMATVRKWALLISS